MTGIITKVIKMAVGIVTFLFPKNLFMEDVFLNFNKYIDLFIDFLHDVNFLVPLPDIFASFSFMVTMSIIKFTLFITNWIIKRCFDVIP